MRRTIKQSQNNFNRNVHLELLTANSSCKLAQENILFEDGNAIMTNGYLLVIAPIKEISTLCDELISRLDNKCIHREHFKALLKCDLITDITENHIIALNNKIEWHIPFADNRENFPLYKNLFPVKETEFNENHQISFNAIKLALICKVFHQKTPILTFHGDRSPIELRFANRITHGLIMPSLPITTGSI